MIELTENWQIYYDTTDPVKRQEMCEGLIQESGEDFEFVRELFTRRHIEKNRPVTEVDRFLYACILFQTFVNGGFFAKGANKKETKKIFENMGVKLADNEIKETLLYWEMRNTLKRYYETCTSDNYRRKIFGLMKASDVERKYYVLKDTREMSVGLMNRVGEVEGIELWSKAVIDEYDSMPDCSASDITGD